MSIYGFKVTYPENHVQIAHEADSWALSDTFMVMAVCAISLAIGILIGAGLYWAWWNLPLRPFLIAFVVALIMGLRR